ncbi:MAG: penicillin-binding protein 1C [Bacteroidetes bacterium]|nr:MAG: penicillin-binding protein 1C [Bacteroidota bacterium]
MQQIPGMFFKYRKWMLTILMALLLGIWFLSLRQQLFPEVFSTVMYDSEKQLLNATVARDGQWRFPPGETLPENYLTALINFEDRYFQYHPGFNPLAIGRAILQNVKKEGTKSGASTLSMQVIRLSRQGKPRTIREKIIEVLLAMRLELRYSKEEILQIYAAHAPMGGNVVGLQAASWRYYGHRQEELSWAEAATLAVLPNSPSLIFPGRNQELLVQKRNRLLTLLHKRGYMDDVTLQLSLAEPAPGAPHPLPQMAPHLFTRSILDGKEGMQIYTTINSDLQQRSARVIQRHHEILRANHIHNVAVLVADVNTGEILVYWGNAPESKLQVNAAQVDIISSRRSPGSLLKPFLYAGLLQEGQILPHSLIPDIPTHFQGFNPENFTRTYDGAVPASRALARSLNIPAVRMLQDYHPDKFHALLKSCGMNTFDKPSSHYGLSMILGGGEVTMWEIAGAYASMARSLNKFQQNPLTPEEKTFHPLRYTTRPEDELNSSQPSPFSHGVLWHTLEAMVEAARPDTEANWQLFTGNRRIAWKTGTSYGHRDAWSIGVNAGYVVAVWAGNATGEGRPGLTGIAAAAPLMFDILGLLPQQSWFAIPYDDLTPVRICKNSGYPASQLCAGTDTILAPRVDFQTGVCPYHIAVHLDKETGLRVNTQCASWADMQTQSWFVLPPVQEYYFRQKNPFYRPLPPLREGCSPLSHDTNPMQWIYPSGSSAIFIPYELDGSPGETIFRVAHRHESSTIHWHLNEQYVGSTMHFHEMAFRPSEGLHTLQITDNNGNFLKKEIQIVIRTPQ